MVKAHWLGAFGFAVVTLVFSLGLAAQAGDPAAIQQKLNSQFKLTTVTADRSDIVKAGDIVEIHQPGLLMYGVDSPLPPSNSAKGGKISQGWGGFGKDLVIGMAAPGGATAASYAHRQFVVGEKCWVTAITVQNDGVLFALYSDPYDNVRYYANLKIPYPNKKVVPAVDAALQLVADVLTVVPQNQGDQQTPAPAVVPPNPAQGGPPTIAGEYTAPGGSRILLLPDGSFTKFVGGGQGHGQYSVEADQLNLTFPSTGFAQHFTIQDGGLMEGRTRQVWARSGDAPGPAAATPLPDIAPPPPPPDAPPPTITIGQTKEQVTAAFGQPLKMAKVGVKEILYYKDMKVTFTNGKVSNVE
jgi:hypothetical protein